MTTRPSSPFALGYLATPGAAAADYSWRLYAVAYSMPPAALLYLLFPHEEPTSWSWIGVSAAFLVLAIGIGIVEMLRTTQSDCGNTTSPWMTVALTMSVLASIFAVEIGVTPWTGSLRWLLLVPTLVIVTFANTSMFAIIAATSFGSICWVLLVTGVPAGRAAMELLAAAAIVACYRIFAVRTVAEFARDLIFGSMSEVAATVDRLDDGWAQLLPLACAYLAGEQITLVEAADDGEHGSFTAGLREVVRWPPDEPGRWVPERYRDLAIDALASARPVHVSRAIGIPIIVTRGRPLAAIVVGAPHRLILDMYQETRANHVAQQLGVLVNRIRSFEELERLTRTDSLTGLHNRRELMVRLGEVTDPTGPSAAPLCAAMVDLDHFKAYNDDFGHQAGDRALEAFAFLMSSHLRSTDAAFRYGGEEFAVLLPGTGEGAARRLLDGLRLAMPDLRVHRPLTISVGIATWIEGELPEDLISRADQALYKAKADGRNRCRVWDPATAGSSLRPPYAPLRRA